MRLADPVPGTRVAFPAGFYPEAFVRAHVSMLSVEATTDDSPERVAESSPLFWDQGTPSQVIARAESNGRYRWTLSLTRWGVVRWELRRNGDAQPLAAAESRFALQSMVDLGRPFWVGVTLRTPWDTQEGDECHVRLLVGQQPGPGMHVVGMVGKFAAPGLRAVPSAVAAGCGPERTLPLNGIVHELFVANSTEYRLFDDLPESGKTDAEFDCGSCLSSRMLDSHTVSVSPGVVFGATSNYWHFFRLDSAAIRRVHFRHTGEMGSTVFVSPDRMHWTMVPMVVAGRGAWGEREGMVELPEREGPLYVANAPVYAATERDRDLARARELGASVEVVAHSTLGNPVHVVTLTDTAAPLEGKQGVVLLCGQHSPLEQMGGRLGMPCLEELHRLSASGETAGILRRMVFYWVPILNIDCAVHGTNGSDARRTNPNRCWFVNRGPEQEGVEAFFEGQESQGVRMAMMLDIHGGGMWRNHNILADLDCLPENPDMKTARLQGPDASKPELFGELLSCAGLREVWWNGRSSQEKKRAPEWFQDRFGCPAFTIECSVVTCFDRLSGKTRPFTQESYERLGQDLGGFFAHLADSDRASG